MSSSLSQNDFQCLQDQLVELRTKNYELVEQAKRSRADFEAAKAKIHNLQVQLEEQEHDFQVTSTTLRREIEAVSHNEANKDTINNQSHPHQLQPQQQHQASHDGDQQDYKTRHDELLPKFRDLEERHGKTELLVQQLDEQNKSLIEKIGKLEDSIAKLKKQLESKQKQCDAIKKDRDEKIKEEKDKLVEITNERDNLKKEVDRLTAEVEKFDCKLESEVEERKIHDKKGQQIVKDLKRQLALERNKAETLQRRLESFLKTPPSSLGVTDLETRTRLSTNSSSPNGNESSKGGNESRTNPDATSVGSWSFLQMKDKTGDNITLNETLSSCSLESESRETVQQPNCDNISLKSAPQATKSPQTALDISSQSNGSSCPSNISTSAIARTSLPTEASSIITSSNLTSTNEDEDVFLEEQAALMERITRLQHEKWSLEEKLAYLEQANCSMKEDLSNKTRIIKNYFMEQAMRTGACGASSGNHSIVISGQGKQAQATSSSPMVSSSSSGLRKLSFPGTVNNILPDKVSIKKVVDFIKDKSQLPSADSDALSKEATKKMQLMLEETLIKCLNMQESLDLVTCELNKLKG